MTLKNRCKLGILTISLITASQAVAVEELAQKNNCLACHSVEKKVLGPSFKDIAAKYKEESGAAEMLIGKIKNGGTGNWGQIPMPANAALSDEDAVALIEWVLSL